MSWTGEHRVQLNFDPCNAPSQTHGSGLIGQTKTNKKSELYFEEIKGKERRKEWRLVTEISDSGILGLDLIGEAENRDDRR